jgi:hypothetical protein
MNVASILTNSLIVFSLLYPSHAFSFPRRYTSHQINPQRCLVRLQAKEPKLGKKEGVYVRPSAAIERGSGFFVPGLEGPKVRLVSGFVLLCALLFIVTNSPVTNAGNNFANGLTAVFATIVLLQAAIEFQKGSSPMVQSGSAAPILVTWTKQWLVPSTDTSWRDRVEWAASSFLSLTSATNILLVGPGKVVFSLGTDKIETNKPDSCLAALNTLSESKSGRVAVPMLHPSVALFPNDVRCVILQRVSNNSQLCWIVASNQLLASFTKQDLTWLGRLAEYVDVDP